MGRRTDGRGRQTDRHRPGSKDKTNHPLVVQMVKNLPAMQETRVRSLGWEDSPGEGKWQPTPVFLMENPMDGGAWWAVVHARASQVAPGYCQDSAMQYWAIGLSELKPWKAHTHWDVLVPIGRTEHHRTALGTWIFWAPGFSGPPGHPFSFAFSHCLLKHSCAS